MKKMLFSVLIAGLVVLQFQSCSNNTNEDQPTSNSNQLSGKIVLTGSSTIAPLASEIGKRFESIHPKVRVDVQTGGSSRGITDAAEGTADIGMSSRALVGDETKLYSLPIAFDGVCFLVHKENPVDVLTNKQITDIYTGKIENWKEVGGNDAPIIVINRTEGRSELELFTEYFGVKKSDINADVVVGDNEQGIKTVAGNVNSIVYMSIGTSVYDEELGIPIKLLPLDGVEATLSNVQNETFPIYRPLILITKTEPRGLAKKFIDYARSGDVHDIVKEQYFVPVSK